ncbi:MAG: nickel-dependent hydrogenase large subunit [Candidatus Hodarchaeaceae archaeon]|nr:nickel-dependent hydrogenase large subunit [Candidatus Hodarchaeaceae archaeon]
MSKVIVGPYHPALLEPELYEVTVRENKIVDVSIRQGYTHRGIEKLMETKSFHQNVFVCERICGFCSHAHTCCYCQAVEELFGIEIPERASYIRTLIFELERLHSHYLWLALFFHTLHDKEQFIRIVDARERLMDLFEPICGNRVHYAINAIGGVRRDVTQAAVGQVEKVLNELEALSENTLLALEKNAPKLSGLGPLSREKALNFGAVGPVLRASGVKSDIRRDDPYAAYDEVDFEVITENGCDVLARALVRAMETYESMKIIRQLLSGLPLGEIKKEVGKPPVREETSRVEAPRGELIYYVRSDGTNIPRRVKLRPPTYANDRAVIEMLQGQKLGDLPIILESLDRCISCTNRLTIIDERTGSKKQVKLTDLG